MYAVEVSDPSLRSEQAPRWWPKLRKLTNKIYYTNF